MSRTVQLIVTHIRELLNRHRISHKLGSLDRALPPLFVGVQGPQGIGKTTITSHLQSILGSAPFSDSVEEFESQNQHDPTSIAVISLDDFYFPHNRLVELASKPTPSMDSTSKPLPPNKLLAGRGQPGTHDIPLLTSTLTTLFEINEPISITTPDGPSFASVEIPTFDKSLHNGLGDRGPPGSGLTVRGPIDIVLVEGWCFGFYPLSASNLDLEWDRLTKAVSPTSARSNSEIVARPEEDIERSVMSSLEITRAEIEQINEYVGVYAMGLYPYFTGFIQLAPPASKPYSLIYKWRLEQEHWMKKQNGGQGMSDEKVKIFIDRYIPGYVFFSEGIRNGYAAVSKIGDVNEEGGNSQTFLPPWIGNGLRISIDEEREVVDVQAF